MNYLLEPVIGICRFSFCGNGDWAAYANLDSDTDIDLLRLEQAERLYDDARMALRFHLFETFLLPSLQAQKDPNFVLIVLTSDIMPAKHLKRLHKICEADDRLLLVVSDATSVHEALMPEITRLNSGLSRPLVQFRIDDDDCLSEDYVKELRAYMLRLGDVMPVSYSRSTGLVVTSYAADNATHVYRANLPFNSMGTAIRVHGERTIFSFGHAALLRRFPAVVDNSGMGFLSIKIDGHDSRPINAEEHGFKRAHAPLKEADTETILSKWFGFLHEEGQARKDTLVRRVEEAAGLVREKSAKRPRLKAV
ncbi:glycosyltransferase [Marivita hallyeonensis]|uniref:Putative rhamnosyl transferase n=1 Tax=Marivita hallyeonensis TaxID=996342 RepID=A0A1M5Y762_9RHOB|nr:glycosyltransferase [Marivita hallyeonensis]SHI07323.1 Putative rhamnosyl transferase [Marivita hallyeonensis]